MFTASYARLHEQGLLRDRAATALEQLRECRLCPRACGIDRTLGRTGFCRTGRLAKAAKIGRASCRERV